MSDAPILRIDDLTVSVAGPRGRTRIVDGVSFDIPRAGSVGLVGESGCGKSLTAFSILGLLPSGGTIDAGRIELEGRDLVPLDDRALSDVRGRRVGLVFQEPAAALDPVYSVGDQIVEAIRLHRRVSRRDARAEAVEWLRRVGMPAPAERFDSFPHELSGGMRQRAMLAIAMVNKPALLVADEPTTALDRTLEAQILELFEELRAEHGTALLLSSHDLAVVGLVTEQVVVMYAGQVVERGPTRAVLDHPEHPYTAALIASIPDPERHPPRERGGPPRKLPTIPGQVPAFDALPVGCRFAPRCTDALPQCSTTVAPWVELGGGRGVRCHLHDHLHDAAP